MGNDKFDKIIKKARSRLPGSKEKRLAREVSQKCVVCGRDHDRLNEIFCDICENIVGTSKVKIVLDFQSRMLIHICPSCWQSSGSWLPHGTSMPIHELEEIIEEQDIDINDNCLTNVPADMVCNLPEELEEVIENSLKRRTK